MLCPVHFPGSTLGVQLRAPATRLKKKRKYNPQRLRPVSCGPHFVFGTSLQSWLIGGVAFVASLAGPGDFRPNLDFASIEKAVTWNLASASSVDTISTPKQIWFKADLPGSHDLVIAHWTISRRLTVPEVKLVVATNAM